MFILLSSPGEWGVGEGRGGEETREGRGEVLLSSPGDEALGGTGEGVGEERGGEKGEVKY